MRVIIVGCGKVGETIASDLGRENHNVVIIDREQKVVDDVTSRHDIMGVCGNGASSEVLKEAGVQKADLLIAVTISDEINIMVCLIAKKLGVKSTIARIRNPEYTKDLNMIKNELGLSMAINPEKAAAREIAELIRFPAAVEVSTFVKSRIEIFKILVTENSPLNNIKVKDIFSASKQKVLICAIERENESVIPNGETQILAGDKISVVVPSGEEVKFFRWADVLKGRISNAIIVGGGKISFYLAETLLRDGIGVKIFEKNQARCEELSELLPKAVVIHGEGDEHKLLIDEGLEDCGAFVSMTDLDEENVVLSMFASSHSNCKVITKINHHTLVELSKEMNVGSVITPKLLTAQQILRYVRAMQNSEGSNVETLYKLSESVEALEFKVSSEESFIGKELMNLKIKKNLIIACINRNGTVIIPGGRDTIELGDNVIIVTTEKGFNDISDIVAD